MHPPLAALSQPTLTCVIQDAVAHLQALGYSAKYMRRCRSIWTAFARYTANETLDEGDAVALVSRFLASCGLPPTPSPGTLSSHQRMIQAVMRILTEFALHPRFRTTHVSLSNFGVSIHSPLQRRRLCDTRTALPSRHKPQPYRTQVLDHLGLVAGMFEELGITEVIDQATQQDPAMRIVTAGHAVKAMVLNGLGFVNQQLSLVPHFFQNKPISRLIAPGMQASHLNDDTLGRALDTLVRLRGDGTLQPHCRHGGQALGAGAQLRPSR